VESRLTTLAIAALRAVKPIIALIDPESGDVRKSAPAGIGRRVESVVCTDGKSIVFSGNRGGLLDVPLIRDRRSRATDVGSIRRLEPVVSPDGTFVVFVTERFSTNLDTPRPARFGWRVWIWRHGRGCSRFRRTAPESAVLGDGQTLTFIAEPDGIANGTMLSMADPRCGSRRFSPAWPVSWRRARR
jgi:hypothetical protein